MAHWPDVGGTLDGVTTDIFSEGLQMPIVKIYRKGVPNEELISDHPHECAPARARDGRLPRPDRRGEDRRERFLEMIEQIRPRRRARRHRRRSWTRARRPRARACAQSPTASTRPSRSWTTTASPSASACRSGCKVEVAGDRMTVDLTDVSQAGRGLLQFRRDRGPLVLPGRVQVPDLGARPADQRRPVPRARHRAAAGPRGQRASSPPRCACG